MSTSSKTYTCRVQAQPVGFFETPVAYGRLVDGEPLMNDLTSAIRQRKAADEGVKRSNIGGWHSDTGMLNWGGPAARQLADTAVKMAKRMTHFKDSSVDAFDWTVQMWANVTPKGGMNDVHVHPGNLWAAVLYLDMGDDGNPDADVGGHFFIEDPRFPMITMRHTGMRMLGVDGNPQDLQPELKLQRGSLLVFPAWLRHGVRPYTGDHERMTIAINIDAIPKLIA
ncbi:MAG: hypothetical protein RLZZ385_1373 [Pseudomonadota bacterium]|jgi:uncharacterized protein (TIGR02466 family)